MNIFSLRFAALAFAIVVNSFLAALVYKNNPKNATNKIFGALSLVTILWLFDVYLSVSPGYITHGLLWVRLSILLASLQILLFYLLADTLPFDKIQMKIKTFYYLLLITFVVMIDAISPFAFKKESIIHGQTQADPGFGLAFFVIFAISLSCAAIIVLLRKLFRSRGSLKDQYRYVVLGLSLMLGLLIGTVLIPVALLQNHAFVPFVPLYTIIFLGFTTIAIIRHRLFDIRLVIARSVTYLLTITTFIGIFTVAAFVITYLFFGSAQISSRQQFIYIGLALIFTPIVYWLKRLFDRLSNKLFFRDAYNPQQVLDELSEVLVGNIQIDHLLKRSSEVMTNNLKVIYCNFVIFDSTNKIRLVGHNLNIDQHKLIELLRSVNRYGAHTIIEDLPDQADKLKQIFRSLDIGVIIRLKTHTSQIGYMLLSEKKSGNPYSKQDIQLLSIAADELALATQNALRFEQIENFNITLQQKIIEATKQLQHSNKKLKQLDETKDDFISMASHQLRTPLTSVKGYISMVLEGDAGKITKTERDMLGQAYFSSQRMVYLIADLLNVSRLKTGKFVIERNVVNLATLVAQELEQLKETAAARKLTLTYDQPKEFPDVVLDETKTRQVIMNFVDNAIYYTPAGGHIEVRLINTPTIIELRIEDDGIGVARSEQPHLFTKFYRAGNARKARPDGTGLGLFMAKKVIIAEGGNLVFESEEGKGSTFGFTFSKAKIAVSTDKNQTSSP